MAPKKKQQQQKQKQKTSSSSSSKGTMTPSAGPKLQISVENENRLRRLLLNSGRSTPASVSAAADDFLSKEKKAKRLRSVYERLSCEGFRDDQIELALSTLKETATFEAALDWLCLNLRGHELPTKFSSGTSLYESEGSIGVISTSRNDWVSSRDPPAIILEDKKPQVAAKRKGRSDGETLDSLQPSQADWIRQYMEQQEEDEYDSWEDNQIDNDLPKKVLQPRSNPESILEEYNSARMEAINAKERGDKKGQEQAGLIIRRLKQEIFALGLSDDILASAHVSSSYRASKDTSFESKPSENFDSDKVTPNDIEGSLASTEFEPKGDRNMADNSGSHERPTENVTLSVSKHDGTALEGESRDVELGGLFVEDDTSGQVPLDLLELQKKEKLKELSSGKNLKKLEGIWKKGDPQKVPKAFLQQLCQRAGWEAPKYDKVTGRGRSSSYSVSILQKASGRGKSRKVGGLTNVLLPDQDETFDTAEDAQNKVAAYALHSLFPDLPVHVALMEPYASVVLKWKEEELFTNVKENKEDRRAGFVDSLLSADRSESNALADVIDSPLQEKAQEPCIAEGIGGGSDQNAERINQDKGAESSYMKKVQERKKEMGRYKEMLETRSRLPIFEKKGDILHLLEENNVLVICGETGCGKTTQVPQYIVDDKIEAGRGGYCNIICTQPRRIAATSVAERVADERCEPSPGSNNSLVGYQVRLDSARNERTKLLFCTTGILLRMISGDKDLAGVSHVIVDEVHERSLLGDFLLIVMKNLIEKQSRQCKSKLKLILMSATVDSHMFSRYFDNCPVITVQGRTHPVSIHYLEDVYETLEYRLASDSPACINNEISVTQKSAPVGNHRGKKNLVLASWGDESVLSEEYINPFYDPSNYQNYREQTRQNLRRLNEDIIDYDLLEDLICHVDETYAEGAILVFLPGVPEINLLLDKLAACHQFGGLASEWLLPLHSSIASEDQKKVFQKAPDNIRKVIIATNIAETSITIDDVVYVIDCGKHKENRYNPQKKLSSMVEDWISQANARQRRGRAGRVKPGICFCLYTRHRNEKLMRPYQMPEMMRMPLVELCLQVKLLSLGSIKHFLSKALEPPREEAISSAISSLYEVGAIEGDEELTPLGYHLAKLPVDVLIGKMMLYGGIFGCLSPILTISAFLSHKSPFVYPKDERENVERAKLALATNKIGDVTVQIDGIRQSDHLIMMIAYQKWDKTLREHGTKAAHRFCSSHFLSSSVMFMIREMRIQLGTLLADIGIITIAKNYKVGWKKNEKLDNWLSDSSQQFNKYSCHFPVVKAILCAGLYPNVAMIEGGSSEGRPVWYDGKREVHIHPSSVNSSQKAFQYPFIVFLEKVETTKVFLRDTTVVSPYSILLFGGSINVQHQSGLIDVDDWLKMAAPAQTAVLFKELRSTLHSILKELIRNPQVLQKSTVVDNEVIRSIIQLFLEEDKPTG